MSAASSTRLPQMPEKEHGGNGLSTTNSPDNDSSQKGLGLEPFPNFESQDGRLHQNFIHTLETSFSPPSDQSTIHTPITGLRLQTDQLAQKNRQDNRSSGTGTIPESAQPTVFNAGLPVRHSSIRSGHSARTHRAGSLSPGSSAASPAVGMLADMTPLPSPISQLGSPGQWRRSMDDDLEDATAGAQATGSSLDDMEAFTDSGRLLPKKRKIPILAKPSLEKSVKNDEAAPAHVRNRSISDYVPEGMQVPNTRNIAVSTSAAPPVLQQLSPPHDHLHREQCLAVQRGLEVPKPPTPPDSNRGSKSDELERPSSPSFGRHPVPQYYEATTISTGRTKHWRALRQLGEGQFSKVMLASSDPIAEQLQDDVQSAEKILDPHSLVAVKVCNHGPAGGADEKSLQTSIQRELDLMKSIDHPSLVHLKAINRQDRLTLFVLSYCPGGDLFELASTNLHLLKSSLVRRIFAELVDAVQYLHKKLIVHRDIKLENILVTIKPDIIPQVTDWQMYNKPVVSLSDLGLGRELPRPPESPLLSRRCGSEDYAAPEVLIGQDYDGRCTDAWALGVVLYTLLEGRMPFDPIPGSRRRSPTSHKIARCEWQWVKYADADGEWDPVKGKDLEGAREIVEGLLCRTRSRWSLDRVQDTEWVKGGIQVKGGLQREDEE